MSARTVYKIEVHSFDIGAYEKEQLLKPLEEAAEVFGAFQYDDWDGVVDELADCITACANVYARMGLDQSEVDAAMERCRKRNEERGAAVSRVDYVRCDMCGRELEPDAPMGWFMGARWMDGTEAFDLCSGCSERVQRFIMHANDTDGSEDK